LRIFHPFAEKPPWRDLHKILHDGSLTDVINRAKFNLNPIRGFDSVGVELLASRRKEKSPLTQGLNYRSACDKCTKHQFIHLLAATLKNSHIENSKNHKRWYCPHHTDCGGELAPDSDFKFEGIEATVIRPLRSSELSALIGPAVRPMRIKTSSDLTQPGELFSCHSRLADHIRRRDTSFQRRRRDLCGDRESAVWSHCRVWRHRRGTGALQCRVVASNLHHWS